MHEHWAPSAHIDVHIRAGVYNLVTIYMGLARSDDHEPGKVSYARR